MLVMLSVVIVAAAVLKRPVSKRKARLTKSQPDEQDRETARLDECCVGLLHLLLRDDKGLRPIQESTAPEVPPARAKFPVSPNISRQSRNPAC